VQTKEEKREREVLLKKKSSKIKIRKLPVLSVATCVACRACALAAKIANFAETKKKTFLPKESLPSSETFGKANFKYIFAITKSA
jgi:hypothetical protein